MIITVWSNHCKFGLELSDRHLVPDEYKFNSDLERQEEGLSMGRENTHQGMQVQLHAIPSKAWFSQQNWHN